MSTRSGKRIHNSLNENVSDSKTRDLLKLEKKTKKKKIHKESLENQVSTNRQNYVSYPTDDEEVANEKLQNIRKTRKHKLSPKERNIDADFNEELKKIRLTRQSKKVTENIVMNEANYESITYNHKPIKVQKKRKRDQNTETKERVTDSKQKITKKKTKKIRSKKATLVKTNHNDSDLSVDSFQSAAGSPRNVDTNNLLGREMKSLSDQVDSSVTYVKKHHTNFEQVDTSKKSLQPSTQSPSVKSPIMFDIIGGCKSNGDCTPNTLDTTFDKETKHDLTSDKINNSHVKSILSSDSDNLLNLTFDKNTSHISIISEDSNSEHLVNTTPQLIESSLDDSKLTSSKEQNSVTDMKPSTFLKREGTFTKESPGSIAMFPNIESPKHRTPSKISLPLPGSTPYHSNTKVSQKKELYPLHLQEKPTLRRSSIQSCVPSPHRNKLNKTHSVEKPMARRSSTADLLPRVTRVMFCSPVNNPTVAAQRKSKIIKSNLKGSNKSFVLEEPSLQDRCSRKRSHTQNDLDENGAKRKCLAANEMAESAERLSRPRTPHGKLPSSSSRTPSQPRKPQTPGAKAGRAKLPNFAELHQKQFSQMESLAECQQRRAARAKQLLVPSGGLAVLERSSPRVLFESTTNQKVVQIAKKVQTPNKSKPTDVDRKSGYTRFGFKLNMDANPFSFTGKPQLNSKESKPIYKKKSFKELSLPSLTGATAAKKEDQSRKELAKRTVMARDKLFLTKEKRDETRKECRTIIKGVRTNRRFELQMKSRNIN